MIKDAVPITIPSAVKRKRTLLAWNESTAMLTISLNSIVRRAVEARGWLVMPVVRRAVEAKGGLFMIYLYLLYEPSGIIESLGNLVIV
jgi:hypothetical protein